MIFKYFKIILFGLILFFVFPFLSYAINYNVVGSNCPNGSIGLYKSESYYNTVNLGCKSPDSDITNNMGIVKCAENYFANGLQLDAIYTDFTSDKDNVIVTHYYIGRIDAWSSTNSYNQWLVTDGLGIKTCPGMYLKYTTATNNYIIDQYRAEGKDVKLISMTTWNSDDSLAPIAYNNSWNTISEWLNTYKVPDLNVYDGWIDDKGTLIYTTEIGKLRINSSVLGYNGRTYKHSKTTQGYHYYIPYKLVISYPKDKNKCFDYKYAAEHPNECCYEYPETCCGNEAYIKELYSVAPNHYIFSSDYCCMDDTEYQGVNIFSEYKFDTFKKYIDRNDYFKKLYNEICKEDYCSFDVPKDNKMHCCNKDEYKNDVRCKEEEEFSCGAPGSKNFMKNLTFCCEETKETMSNNQNWKKICKDQVSINNNLSCKTLDSSATYSKTEKLITIYDEMVMIPSDKQSTIMEVKAGQGFNYDLATTNTTTISGVGPSNISTYNTKTELDKAIKDYNDAFDKKISDINKDIMQKFNNQSIYFNSKGVNFNYDIAFSITDSNKRYTPNKFNPEQINTKKVTYKYFDNNSEVQEKEYIIKTSISIENTYIIKPYMYYININKSENEGVYATKTKDYENNSKYVKGGRLVYTKTTDKTGIYSFSISIKNGGITGEINATGNDSYTCEYRVLNCIRDGDCQKETEEPYYFRSISLSTPFPNNRLKQNKVGSNWLGNASNTKKSKIQEYITEKGDSVYGNPPMYYIKLDSETISMIKSYNRNQEIKNGYLDWDSMVETKYNEFYRKSSMLNCLADGKDCRGGLSRISSDKISIPSDNTNIRITRIGDFTYPNKEYK